MSSEIARPTPVYAIGSGVCCPLAMDTEAFVEQVSQLQSSLRRADYFHSGKLMTASGFTSGQLDGIRSRFAGTPLTLFEKISVLAASEALEKAGLKGDAQDTVFILSTTKGNIELLHQGPEVVSIWTSAEKIKNYFGNPNRPVVVSHACISGVLAQITGLRLIRAGRFKHAVVIGADRLSSFVVDGFNAFQALDPEPCRPFDQDRAGLNLGEGAGCMILSARQQGRISGLLLGSGVSNDANHISGPSRTGEELGEAINRALKESRKSPTDVDTISAHGTATRYNDDMESRAFTLAGVSGAAVHSLKAYIGHTLGAAGVLETILALEAMQKQIRVATPGFAVDGTPFPLQVQAKTGRNDKAQLLLKTASGFGGCNAAVIWERPA